MINERSDTPAVFGIRDTYTRRNAIGSRIPPEVAVERAVLLHDHNNMLDLVNAAVRCGTAGTQREGGDDRRGERHDDCRDPARRPHVLAAAHGDGVSGPDRTPWRSRTPFDELLTKFCTGVTEAIFPAAS